MFGLFLVGLVCLSGCKSQSKTGDQVFQGGVGATLQKTSNSYRTTPPNPFAPQTTNDLPDASTTLTLLLPLASGTPNAPQPATPTQTQRPTQPSNPNPATYPITQNTSPATATPTATRTSTPSPTPTATQTNTPSPTPSATQPATWPGEWVIYWLLPNGTTRSGTLTVSLEQTQLSASADFGQIQMTFSGTVYTDGKEISGNYAQPSESGTFFWLMNATGQFIGNLDNLVGFCGAKQGMPQPNPCEYFTPR